MMLTDRRHMHSLFFDYDYDHQHSGFNLISPALIPTTHDITRYPTHSFTMHEASYGAADRGLVG